MRRTAIAYVYEKFQGSVSGDKGYITLQQACTLFGFQMNENWTKKEIDKRFRKLVQEFHPDHGGSNDEFREIREAHNLLLTHRRDRHKDRKKNMEETEKSDSKDAGSAFNRKNASQTFYNVHQEMSTNPELRTFEMRDFVIFSAFITVLTVLYMYRTVKTQRAILRGRWSYTTQELEESETTPNVNISQWHPWKSDSETRDAMDEIGVLQGSIREDVVERKRKQTPRMYTPWQPGGPFKPKSTLTPAEEPKPSPTEHNEPYREESTRKIVYSLFKKHE